MVDLEMTRANKAVKWAPVLKVSIAVETGVVRPGVNPTRTAQRTSRFASLTTGIVWIACGMKIVLPESRAVGIDVLRTRAVAPAKHAPTTNCATSQASSA